MLRCTNRWHLLAPALIPASSIWVLPVAGVSIFHIAQRRQPRGGASASTPNWSAVCSPVAYHLPHRDLERGLLLGLRSSGVGGLAGCGGADAIGCSLHLRIAQERCGGDRAGRSRQGRHSFSQG